MSGISMRTWAIIAGVVAVVVLAVWGPAPKSASLGNTLMAAAESKPDSLDPAMSYQAVSWQLQVNAYDGLLTYKKESGLGGATLVPDLATAMPTVSADRLTYSFTMRTGVKWGPPLHRDVQPSDEQYGIERMLKMASPGSGFFLNIHGAQDFVDGKATHISGIHADDTAHTISFQLDKPDPTFTFILALPFSFAVPTGTPLKDMSTAGFVPAIGPYMFTKYDPQREIVMKRNPNFHQYAPDVPTGYVDGIHVRVGVNPENAVTLVQRGKIDYMLGAVPRSRLPSLLNDAKWKHQLYIDPAASVSYIYMNTRIPPFNDQRMRQAINWAIDRRAMVKLSGGVGVPTETILPPGFPGYKEHHLYPHQDLAMARKLIKDAGYTPGKIDIWCRTNEPNPTFAVYLQDVMTQLGFKPTVKCVDSSVYFDLVGNEKTKAMIGFGNWGQDFPEGSDFIDVLLNGKRITPEHNNNLAWYSGADPQIAAANALQDQHQRDAAWGALDEQIVRDGAWAPFMHGVLYTFTSKRFSNYTYSPVYGTLLMQVQLKGEEGAS